MKKLSKFLSKRFSSIDEYMEQKKKKKEAYNQRCREYKKV